VAIWYISPRFGIVSQEKSGSPGDNAKMHFLNRPKNANDSTTCVLNFSCGGELVVPDRRIEST
jgi:hypothetical protein